MIKVSEFTKTGFSESNAKPIFELLQKLLSEEDEILIDFSDVKAFTTLFFNNSLGKFFLELGPDEYERRIKVINLSEIGSVAYSHYLANAKQVYDMKRDGRLDDYTRMRL